MKLNWDQLVYNADIVLSDRSLTIDRSIYDQLKFVVTSGSGPLELISEYEGEEVSVTFPPSLTAGSYKLCVRGIVALEEGMRERINVVINITLPEYNEGEHLDGVYVKKQSSDEIKGMAPSENEVLFCTDENGDLIKKETVDGVVTTENLSEKFMSLEKDISSSVISVSVEKTMTLPETDPADVVNVGDDRNLKLRFYIPKGDKGDRGERGEGSKWHIGTDVDNPTAEMLTMLSGGSYNAGDLYLNNNKYDVYYCTRSESGISYWQYVGNIKGVGSAGPKGDKGNTGTRGSVWNSGTALSGTSSTVGNYSYADANNALVGDYYLNTAYGYVYRCTTAGSGTSAKWTYVGSIKGATGSKGSTGSAGNNGTDGTSIYVSTYSGTSTSASGVSITNTDIIVPSGQTLKVGDLILATNGNIYRVIQLRYTETTTRAVYYGSVKGSTGAKGDKGDKGVEGQRGSMWYIGTVLNSTDATMGKFSIPMDSDFFIGDIYFNPVYGYVYKCTTAGKGENAKWTYQGCIRGSKGDKGDKGEIGSEGRGITSIYVEYAQSTTSELPTDWVAFMPTPIAGRYMWMKLTFTYSDGNADYHYISLQNGNNGAKGDRGLTGAEGARGSVWNSGTAMNGTATATGAYSYADADNAMIGDYYLNSDYGYVYRCTTAGNGIIAKWTYQGCIRGRDGVDGGNGSAISWGGSPVEYCDFYYDDSSQVLNISMY